MCTIGPANKRKTKQIKLDLNNQNFLRGKSMKKRILVVDDDLYVRQLFRDFFEDNGFEVMLVEDAISAIMAVRHYDFDIVITDYKLPDIFGHELARKIKSMKPHLPVIGMSAFPYKRLFIQAGADEFFEKPFRLSSLKRTVESLIADRNAP